MRALLIVLASLFGGTALAQQPDFELLIQGDRDSVKLLWMPNHWPKGLTGFNVKRRADGGEWVQLNNGVMSPTVREDDLLTRTNDPALIERLKKKRLEMLAERNFSDVPFEKLLKDTLEDSTGIKFLKFVLGQTYEGALIQGFAYQDNTVPKAGTYEYGLFLVRGSEESAEPYATQTWKYGTRPELSISFSQPEVIDHEYKTKGLQISWTVSTAELRTKLVREFRVMKREPNGKVTALNPTRANHADENPKVGILDFDYPHDQPATFWLEPVDIFDFAGKPSPELAYSAQKYPGRKPSPPPVATLDGTPRPSTPSPPPPRDSYPARGSMLPMWDSVLPKADDPAEAELSNYPVLMGTTSPTAKSCVFKGNPGDPKFCLRPADGMQLWLRADDFGPRYRIATLWNSPRHVQNWATAGEQATQKGYRLESQVKGLPAIRLADGSSFTINVPLLAPEFTVFVVGRQVPGAARGTLLASGPDGYTIGWRDGSAFVAGAADQLTEIPYSGVSDYHVLAVRYHGGTVGIHVNGKPIEQKGVDFGREPGFRFLGVTPDGSASARPFAAFSMNAPEKPESGVDIAELIFWPELLSIEDLRTTSRYLQKKYALP